MTYSVFRDLCWAIQVNPITLEPNDHHSHLWGSLRSREPLTLHQNSIGSHRGDVRPEPCPVGSVPGRALFCLIFAGLYGSTRVSFLRTPITVTSGGSLGVGNRRPCINIPSGATVVTSDSKLAQSGLYGSTRVSFLRTTTTVTSGGQLGVGSRRPCSKNTIGSHRGDVLPETCSI
ncbi:hypothetical protein CRG98_014606 [Punica granatum]|uniref:Uncharacterized protein n=1 Tax=Punica granatum TaxID=22663 RepID=A0A2I0K8Z7_PUNGR|nr:hypothetical protein CRG98_014606 [Punica granatum]